MLWDRVKEKALACEQDILRYNDDGESNVFIPYVTSTLDHVLTTSLPRSKNSRTWRGRGQNETISDF